MTRRMYLSTVFGASMLNPGVSLDSAIEIGDLLTIEGFNAVNPITRKVTIHPQIFSVVSIQQGRIGLIPNSSQFINTAHAIKVIGNGTYNEHN